jgi:outer membrane protein assembly factor BamA
LPQLFTKILFFALIIAFLVSCNAVKYVPEDENLLRENTIYVNEKKKSDLELASYVVQRPNQSALGLPLSLFFYNFGDPEFEETFEEWVENHPKKYAKYEYLFSKKQAYKIYTSKSGFNNWFLTKGQAPIIYDDFKTQKSVKSLQDYFVSMGYFEAEATYDTIKVKDKQVEVAYKITTNNQYYIDSLSSKIESPVIDSIYQATKKKSILKKGNPFVFSDFELEENRLVTLFRNSGVYHFKKNNMGFWTDSTKQSYKKDIVLKIPNRVVYKGDSIYTEPFKVQKVRDVNVYTDFSIKNKEAEVSDSLKYEGYTLFSYDKLNYKPKYLVNSIFIRPNEIFKDAETSLTRNHLRNLKTFSSAIDIKYTENEDESLTADIYLNPLKKIAITFDLDATTSNIKPFGILGKSSLLGRNIFKGFEILELSFQGSFLNVSQDASDDSRFFNAWEMLSSASLKFPRILFPFDVSNVIPKYMAPQTDFNTTLSFQKNIGLDRQTITAGIGYSWKSTKKLGHKLDIFSLQYIKNQNINNYFSIYNSEYLKLNEVSEDLFGEELPDNNADILAFMDYVLYPGNGYETTNPEDYDTVSDVNERRAILIEDVMVPIISYSLIYNTRTNMKDNDFSYFTARFVSAGGITNQLVNNTNSDGQKVLFDLPIAQYFKAELEYKKYWELRQNNTLVFRTFVGAALPYGNSDNIPFSRSYSAGGSNEIRAWRTFDLGPGREVNTLEYNVGTFKLVSNLEYRFKVTSKIHSALFVDAGNIWDITDSNLYSDEAKLTKLSSLKNTAVGSGFGIRYDFGFLVFRFDIGFKTYEPYLDSGKKWLTNYNFGNAVYNIGINYPF